MLRSMTGQGDGRFQGEGIRVAAEVRAVNSRYFKLNFRASEGFAGLESRAEGLVRKHVRRGTVSVDVRIDRERSSDEYRIDAQVLQGYLTQIEQISGRRPDIESLLLLPGVVREPGDSGSDLDALWPHVQAALAPALERLVEMRSDEGAAMQRDLLANCQQIEARVTEIAARAPEVSIHYRGRMTERLNKLLAEHEVSIESSDLVREVGIFAERCDISEEIVRLRSHLAQFASLVDSEDSNGRKLDFLVQEMFRETNTIGSKANDATIAGQVVEAKACIERMREMIQNIE